ncbi:MAG: Hsp20/alpha crystallin family protein [Planctomycetota bacterium]|nr:Hsp20/alpha crystallin family protein [Planctomycetota bacterium]
MHNEFFLKTIRPMRSQHVDAASWQPAADVYRMLDGWLLKVELAGVRPDELQLLVEGCDLILSGRRRDWIIERGRQCHSMEIAYSCFERRFSLPCRVDNCRIATEYRDGMLVIRITTVCAAG